MPFGSVPLCTFHWPSCLPLLYMFAQLCFPLPTRNTFVSAPFIPYVLPWPPQARCTRCTLTTQHDQHTKAHRRPRTLSSSPILSSTPCHASPEGELHALHPAVAELAPFARQQRAAAEAALEARWAGVPAALAGLRAATAAQQGIALAAIALMHARAVEGGGR